MHNGFIKVAAGTPDLKVAQCEYNVEQMIHMAKDAADKGIKLLAFPELGITGYTCNDLFLQEPLLRGATKGLGMFAKETKNLDMVMVVGLPLMHNSRLYNVAAVVKGGRVLGLVPKSYMPGYSEFYESRQFRGADDTMAEHVLEEGGETVPFGTKQLFSCEEYKNFVFGIEICEDLWMPIPPSSYHTMAGATVMVNLSASDENTGKAGYRRDLVKSQSARTVCGYIYVDAGEGESTTDLVFAGHNFIVENGTVLAESERFTTGLTCSEIDVDRLVSDRRRITTLPLVQSLEGAGYVLTDFHLDVTDTKLTRHFEKHPFVPSDKRNLLERCDEILNIQATGLKKRLAHTGCKHAVVGLSGGLDSTLALLVMIRAFDALSIERENIICVTMPCFGTTDRTYDNAINLAKHLGTTLREIPIQKAVTQHFEDIGHDMNVHDITYENGQARERTQILMNIANQVGGMVIGTGDMSELALGWATYNGDHMSMYGVNVSVPKTLVRFLVQYFADTCGRDELKKVLYDVLDTPVSPELLPPKDGEISQKTEDIVGPYELHDFFLYYVMRFGFMPSKIYRLAVYTFQGIYDGETILKWLKNFYRRFFSQQFKRSCLPDGPKVGSVAVSPRGDLRMPSDACNHMWMQDLENIEA